MRASGNIYVAVIDDDSSLCTSFGRLLRLAGFQPISYRSAEDFLEDKKHPQFDCIVLDIRLGGMTGFELFMQIGTQKTCPPVIFITAFDDPEMLAQAKALGCAGYFHKTTPGVEIIEAITKVVNHDSK